MTFCPPLQPSVFVIAPTDVSVQVRAANASVLRFESSEEFEQWSHGSAAGVAVAVYAALAEWNIDLSTSCSLRTQEIIARLCERPIVPSVKELFAVCSSRRSCYRAWTEDLPVMPAEFLTRVRLLHLRAAAAHDGLTAPRPPAIRNRTGHDTNRRIAFLVAAMLKFHKGKAAVSPSSFPEKRSSDADERAARSGAVTGR
ncbi:MAG TPA: hypothetical protein VEK57_16145 [Thermoanaerobaculia bacterium]|nr:hypothetical protein [Thermoanaerobaculia bacterium]